MLNSANLCRKMDELKEEEEHTGRLDCEQEPNKGSKGNRYLEVAAALHLVWTNSWWQ